MQTITKNSDQLLWIGLESYNESNSNIFFGRDEEIQQLSSDIFHNVQTVIYGPSGTGKTSIIRAGIFKVARESGYFPIYIRLSHDGDSKQQKDYYKQIIDSIESEASFHDIDIERIVQYVKRENENNVCGSLWEYLHCNEFWTKENYPITPLIVIDQFEELFTLCKDRSKQLDFFEQISDLCDNRLPMYIKEYVNNRDNERVEYSESANYRFVISLREDFLARLEELAENIPALRRNRFSLQSINDEQALDIITKPSPGLVSEDVAIKIIECVTRKKHGKDFCLHDGADIPVEPAILSLFCAELDKKRCERGSDVISENLIGEFGENIIKDFYLSCLKELSADKIEFLEKGLLTDDGFRDNIALQNVKNNGFTDDEISNLTDRRLVRIEEWDGTKRIEFTHDVLCKVAAVHRNECAIEKENYKILQEKESENKKLQEQQERERTLRNIEYNKKKRATERNVLVHKGRRLMDNALDFGEMRTINAIPLRNPVDKIMVSVRFMKRVFEPYFDEEVSDSDFVNQQVFSDPLLKDSTCVLSFYKADENASTIDGICGVELRYDGTLISDIFFRGKKVLSDGSVLFDEPIYILGGYCGIHIDYDDNEREIQRTYLDDSNQPVITLDGYSVVQTCYDEKDNPIRVRYYNYQNGDLVPIRHLHGNHGYDSVYDKNGNEVERHFVDESGQPTMIISGVYGKRMSFDTENFRLISISNIDSNGALMADIDGYVTNTIVYDKDGMPTLNFYMDENGKPWKTPNGIYGVIDKIDFKNNVIESYNIDERGTYIEDKDGVLKIVVSINEKRQITRLVSKAKNDEMIVSEDNTAIQLWDYDEQNRLQSVKFLSKDGRLVLGKRYDYNKEGTHIIREFALSENGLGKFDNFDVEGIEYSQDDDKGLPILRIFINENKQYKVCNDGYYAIRTWEDDKERVVKQLYYDFNGAPMSDKNGTYGVKVEYIDEHTTKTINLDADGNTMEDNNGVAFTVTTNTPSSILITSYNQNGEPHANDEWVYCYQEKLVLNDGYQERLYVKNSKEEQVQMLRPRRANADWGWVPCIYEETNFDEKGRPISQYFKDADGNLVGDNDGDSYTEWRYNDCSNTEILSLYNVDEELKLRIRIKRDEKGRVIESSYLDKDNNLAELERGYSGEIHEYDDAEKKEIVTFIDSKGNVCDNKDGFAHRIFWYDQFGRITGQKDVTSDGLIHGNIGFREFIDSERRECAYYLHQEDGQGRIVANDGSVFVYFEEDTKGRTIKQLYLDADKLPVMDNDGDYGLSYEYCDDKNLTILTCLDESSQPHNNKSGYGIIHIYRDGEGHETKRMHYTAEGLPATFSELLGCYGLSYEYPNEQNKIIGFLDENGEITTNNYGYAYREDCFNPETKIRRVFYYDKDRNNIQSLEDESKDYGYAIIEEEDNWRRIISLGKDGAISNNACGYAVRSEFIRDGQVQFYKYQRSDEKPIADSIGDYGKEILYSEDGSMIRYVSLNEKYERHLNNLGYCFGDVITDIVGDQIRIWRDMEGNQVLPKLRFAKKIKNILARLKKKEKLAPIFNCRQIGAIFDCILGNIKNHGIGEKYGLRNTYVLLQYDSWNFGEDFEDLSKLMANTVKQSKHLVLLPVTLDGSLLQEVGSIVEMDFPVGQIGMELKEWGINIETLHIIKEKKKEWDEGES